MSEAHAEGQKVTFSFLNYFITTGEMRMNLEQVQNIIQEKEIKTIDLKYSDLVGNWYHITFPSVAWSTF